MAKQRINIYTDGACKGNPGPGGWAFYIENENVERCGREKETTNNRMELLAAINGLDYYKSPTQITIFSDSQYVIKGITDWIHGWKSSNWKNGKVKNIDLWKQLDELNNRHDVLWKWVKGHSGNKNNERVDQLAQKQSQF